MPNQIKVNWTEADYTVGIPSIDVQHKRLVELLVMAADDVRLGKYDNLDKIFDEIFDYTKYHFLHEEKLMRDFGYPEFETHRTEHNAFTTKVNKLYEVYLADRKNPETTAPMMVNMLSVWLKHHIQKEDRGYVDFMKGKGVR